MRWSLGVIKLFLIYFVEIYIVTNFSHYSQAFLKKLVEDSEIMFGRFQFGVMRLSSGTTKLFLIFFTTKKYHDYILASPSFPPSPPSNFKMLVEGSKKSHKIKVRE